MKSDRQSSQRNFAVYLLISIGQAINYLSAYCSYTVGIDKLIFEWDERKARSNEKKHGISFNEAKTVFYDENARLLYDAEHSSEEERYILLGMSDTLSVLVVCHVYEEGEETIRIFSARRANKREQQQYQSFLL